MKRGVILLFLWLLILATAISSTEISIVIDPVPRIDVRFSEDTNIESAFIHRLSDPLDETSIVATYDTTKDPMTEYGRVYSLRGPALINANYLFEMTIVDRVGNRLTLRRQFIITYPETEMRVIRPRLGVATEAEFDLQIQTLRRDAPIDAMCKYAAFNPDNDFEAFGLNPFDIPPAGTVARIHQINNYATVAGLVENAPPRPFYMICLDDRGRPNTKRLEVYIDTIAPSITSATFDPSTIIEYPMGGTAFASTLTVDASEPVICKYVVNDSSANYSDMTEFAGFNRLLFEAFDGSVSTELTFPDADGVTYAVTVECEDRAGLTTGPFVTSVVVDLSAAIGTQITNPGAFTSNTSITLVVTTLKTSYCTYNLDGSGPFDITVEADPRRMHEVDLGDLTTGTHEVVVTCRSGRGGVFQEQSITHSFTIDTTPPGPIIVEGEPITCAADPVSLPTPLTFSATDPESGVDTFEYTVQSTNVTLTGSSITSLPSGSISDNGTSVSVAVRPINGAGLVGPESIITITVDPQRFACLEHDPPVITLEETRLAGITTVALFCEDVSGCDNSSIRTGLSNSAVNCTAGTSYLGPVSVVRTQTLCYYAEDTIGNNVSGDQIITVETSDTCENGVLDEGEADVDCGGTCGGTCGDGLSCAFDSDCLSGYCSDGLCQSVSCDDITKNGAESDVDCGGNSCDACDIGQTCNENTDCVSLYCSDVGTCEEASCSDGVKNANETDDDCGGPDCDVCLNGRRCNGDSDCLSGYCAYGGYCEDRIDPDVRTDFPDEEEFEEKFGWGTFMLTWGLITLGILLIAGGIGYLIYKKKFGPASVARGLPTQQYTQRRAAPAPLRMTAAQRTAILQRQHRIREKVEKERQKKEMERGSALARFGKPIPKAKRTVKPRKTHAPPREEWVSLADLGKKKKMPASPTKVKPSDVDFDKLDRLVKKDEDLFARLPGKKTEEKDVFSRLPQRKGSAKELPMEVSMDKLERLGKKVGGDVFLQLEKKGRKKKKKGALDDLRRMSKKK